MEEIFNFFFTSSPSKPKIRLKSDNSTSRKLGPLVALISSLFFNFSASLEAFLSYQLFVLVIIRKKRKQIYL